MKERMASVMKISEFVDHTADMTPEQVSEEVEKHRTKLHNELMALSKEQLVERLFGLGDLLAEGVLKVQALAAKNVLLTAALEQCKENCPMLKMEAGCDKPSVH